MGCAQHIFDNKLSNLAEKAQPGREGEAIGLTPARRPTDEKQPLLRRGSVAPGLWLATRVKF